MRSAPRVGAASDGAEIPAPFHMESPGGTLRVGRGENGLATSEEARMATLAAEE